MVTRRLCLLLFIVIAGCAYQPQAQESTVRSIRHSLPIGGRQSLDGSLPNGGCTSVNDDGDICNLQDGGTSVLVDNTILPLNGLNGDWARDLYTVERPSRIFLSIGFDFGTSVQVRRVELVLFNCPQRSIRAGSVAIYTDTVTNLFPQSDPTSVGGFVGERLFGVGVNSCTNLYRVCVSLLGANNRIYYIVFPHTAGSRRVYLAETIFYTDTRTCGNDTLVTELVTERPVDTTTEGTTTEVSTSTLIETTMEPLTTTNEATTTEQTVKTTVETTEQMTTKTTATTESETTTQQMVSLATLSGGVTKTNTCDCVTPTMVPQNLPSPSTNTCSPSSLIATALTAITLTAIIVVALHIPLYVYHTRDTVLRSAAHNGNKETAASTDHENDVYEQIDETKFVDMQLQGNEAYGHTSSRSQVTG